MTDEELSRRNMEANSIARAIGFLFLEAHDTTMPDVPYVGLALFLVLTFGDELEKFMDNVIRLKASLDDESKGYLQ